VSEVEPTTPPALALTVVVPTPTGDATPVVLLMVATAVTLDVHDAVTLPVVLSEKVATAVNCTVPPVESEIESSDGVTVIDVMILSLTVIGAVAVTLLLFDLAVRVEVPSAAAVTSPELSTVATLVAEEVQLTCEVTSPVVLLPKVAVAVNCSVLVGSRKAPLGDREIDTI
jgi:hypothetical protein